MSNRNSAESFANETMDRASDATEQATEAARNAYATAQDYTARGVDVAQSLANDLRDFVRREPWIAVAAAFAIGYTMARAMRRTQWR